MDFTSDNAAGVSRPIIEAILAANDGSSPAYGDDPLCAKAASLLSETFETEVRVFLVATGIWARASPMLSSLSAARRRR